MENSRMLVTKLTELTKTKYKVYIDEEFAFVLYKGELLQYHINEGESISEETVSEILEKVLVKRAKLRALHLMNVMDRTEKGLRQKLRDNHYPEEVIEKAITYVKSYGYVEDERYANQFIQNRKLKKSRRELECEMLKKGLSRDVVSCMLETQYDKEDEVETVRRIAEKKGYREGMEDVEKKKIFDFLVRKGFSYDTIRQVLQISL